MPAYLDLDRSEIERRVVRGLDELKRCRVCPRNCDIDRFHDATAVCRSGRYAWIGSAFPHFGEESCLRGTRGSGTIFFSFCNLKCVFCQNFDISWEGQHSKTVRPDELAAIMLELQSAGCHNINFVTPEHVVPQILEALPLAIERGLKLPLVYNTSSYDSATSLELLDGIVDVYMPDFKFWDPAASKRLMAAGDYPDVARRSIREMHRQVGDLSFDRNGLAERGVLLRHLVMPGGLEDTRRILEFVAREISSDTFVNVMGQYHPAGRVVRKPESYPEIARRVAVDEVKEAFRIAREVGLHRFSD